MFHLIDSQDRNKLAEGRNYQLGFAFLKKTGKDKFETVMPITPCKDYLNDVVYSEATGNSCYAYGLSTTKQNLFKARQAYLAIQILEHNGGGRYTNMTKDIQNLKSNKHNIAVFMGKIEEVMGIKFKTAIEDTDKDGIYILKFDKYWTTATWLISMYSLLVRVSQWYNGTQDYMDYLKTFSAFDVDIYLLNEALGNIELVIEEPHSVKQNLTKTKGNSDIHNSGIVAYKNEDTDET